MILKYAETHSGSVTERLVKDHIFVLLSDWISFKNLEVFFFGKFKHSVFYFLLLVHFVDHSVGKTWKEWQFANI